MCADQQGQQRFQIFKKVGVKFNDLFLSTERLQRDYNYFTINLLLEFLKSSIFLGITVFSLFCKKSREFFRKT